VQTKPECISWRFTLYADQNTIISGNETGSDVFRKSARADLRGSFHVRTHWIANGDVDGAAWHPRGRQQPIFFDVQESTPVGPGAPCDPVLSTVDQDVKSEPWFVSRSDRGLNTGCTYNAYPSTGRCPRLESGSQIHGHYGTESVAGRVRAGHKPKVEQGGGAVSDCCVPGEGQDA
jgi:hypothetical protein